MKPCKADLVRIGVCLLFLSAVVPAFAQRGNLGVDVGASLRPVRQHPFRLQRLSRRERRIRHHKTLHQERILPASSPAANPRPLRHQQSRQGIRRLRRPALRSSRLHHRRRRSGPQNLYSPPPSSDNQILNRDRIELLQIPLVLKYKFGPAKRAFISAQGEPEFTPHYKTISSASVSLPDPGFDHGYTLRGTVGYNFGKWYVQRRTTKPAISNSLPPATPATPAASTTGKAT